MPTDDYRCSDCAHEFEVFQRITAAPGAQCPRCGHAARRLVSGGTGLIFKGSGFYITDYKRKEAPGGEAASSGKSPETPSKSEPSAQKSETVKPSSEASAKSSAPSAGLAAPTGPGSSGPAK